MKLKLRFEWSSMNFAINFWNSNYIAFASRKKKKEINISILNMLYSL